MGSLSGKVRICTIALLGATALTVFAVATLNSNAQLATSPSPMLLHDLAHTGRSPYSTSANPGHLHWAFTSAGDTEVSSPAIGADGTIYIGSDEDFGLYAVNHDGSQKWAFPTGSIVYSCQRLEPMGQFTSAAMTKTCTP